MSSETPTTVGSPGTRWRTAAAVVTALSLLLAACGSDDDTGNASSDGSSQIARGEELYQANCASCHGSDLRGTSKGPSHLSVIYEPSHHGDDAFRFAIANGTVQHHWSFGDMEPVPGLTDTEVDSIIAFVRDTQQRESFE